MCGRVSLARTNPDEIADQIDADLDERDRALFRPRWNVAPSQEHWLVRLEGDRRVLIPAVWGFHAGKRFVINARSETVDQKPAFREALFTRRCLIPADGFYEWTSVDGERRPLWFHPPAEGGLLWLAGVYQQEPGEERPRFVVLTTGANALVAPAHDRMPAIIDPSLAAEWFEHPGARLLRPAPEGALAVRPVSPRVNRPENDDAACLDPPPATEKPKPAPNRQLRLFE